MSPAADGLGFVLPDDLPLLERIELAVWAEQNGYREVWCAEIGEPDAFALLSAIAMRTQRLRLGTAIVPLGTRSVAQLAASAATLSALAPGRVDLGLGVSSPAIISGWHGVPFGRPLQRVAETLPALRQALRGERLDSDGEYAGAKGFVLRTAPPVPPTILLAALNQKMLELAGEFADRVWLALVPVSGVERTRAAVARGAARAGRPAPGLQQSVLCCVTDEPDVPRARFRHQLAFYLSSPDYRRALTWHGFGQEAEQAATAIESGDRKGVAAAVSDRLLDELAVFGTADEVRARLDAYRAAGVDELAVMVFGGPARPTLEALAPGPDVARSGR